jgi:hypothetical protein
LTVIQRNGELWLETPGQAPLLLTALAGTTFRIEAIDGEVTFLSSADDPVTGLALQLDGQRQLALRAG